MASDIKSKFVAALFDTTSRAKAADCTAAGAALRESNPSEDLSELPPLFETVAGQGYHCRLTGSWRSSLPKLPVGDGCALAAFWPSLDGDISTGGSWRIPGIAFLFCRTVS